MLFGTYAQDEEYLWKKFQSPEFDPATGLDKDEAAEKAAAFAETAAPARHRHPDDRSANR